VECKTEIDALLAAFGWLGLRDNTRVQINSAGVSRQAFRNCCCFRPTARSVRQGYDNVWVVVVEI